MKSLILAACLLLTVSLGFAQENKSGDTSNGGSTFPSSGVAIVHIRYVRPIALLRLLADSGVTVKADDDLKVLFLAGSSSKVAALEDLIRQLDVPSAISKQGDVEVLVSVVGGSNDKEGSAGERTSEQLAPVIKQLQAVFPYTSYRTLATMLLRSEQGRSARNEGFMTNPAKANTTNPLPSQYTLIYRSVAVSAGEGAAAIHFEDFHFQLKVPFYIGDSKNSFQQFELNIESDLDIKEGQKVVVGKANVENGDSAVFVVVTARVVS